MDLLRSAGGICAKTQLVVSLIHFRDYASFRQHLVSTVHVWGHWMGGSVHRRQTNGGNPCHWVVGMDLFRTSSGICAKRNCKARIAIWQIPSASDVYRTRGNQRMEGAVPGRLPNVAQSHIVGEGGGLDLAGSASGIFARTQLL